VISNRHWQFRLVANRLRRGEVIAYPTEGVWGLGCVPEIGEAVQRILTLKNRDWRQGLILAAGSVAQLSAYLEGLPEAALATLNNHWPGPTTFLVPDNGKAPDWIRGRHEKVALRVSAHAVIQTLCSELNGPIVSTSANPAGRPAALSALRVRQYFGSGIDYIVPGTLGETAGRPSDIVDLLSGQVLRG
jgi:L-threonylcarbamoyladenylate synthase